MLSSGECLTFLIGQTFWDCQEMKFLVYNDLIKRKNFGFEDLYVESCVLEFVG